MTLGAPTVPPTAGPSASGRTLLTALPGPRSRELHAARERAVPRGFGLVLPVFVDHADGALLVDVDGNRLIDMASGIAVTSVGAAAPEVGARSRSRRRGSRTPASWSRSTPASCAWPRRSTG